MKALLLATVALISGAVSLAAAGLPKMIDLKFTVQQREDGMIALGYSIMHLTCVGEKCILETLTINQCADFGLGEAFTPVVEQSGTGYNLKVTRENSVIVIRESGSDIGGDYDKTFRIRYGSTMPDVADKVLGVSGAFVKNSSITGGVITVEYVPVRGRKKVTLDCPVLLPGIETQ